MTVLSNNLTDNEKVVVAFLKMLESESSAINLEKFYHPETEQTEFPNAILKTTAVRNLNDLKVNSEKGSKLMIKQEIEIKKLHSVGDTVILEAVWKGTVSVPVGTIPAGGQMIAYFAQFFEFRDGKIYRQRNYDCFEPFN